MAKLPRPNKRPNWYFPRIVEKEEGGGLGVLGSMAIGGRREEEREQRVETNNLGFVGGIIGLVTRGVGC